MTCPVFPDHELIESGSRVGRLLLLERQWRQVAQARVWTIGVVMLPPLLDDDLRLGACAKPFHAQALVAELAVEAFVAAILPRLAWIDQRGVDAGFVQPLEHGTTDELG